MIANSFFAFLTLVAFLLLFYGPWQAVCTDIARQAVFEKRDEIFDMAREGLLDFKSSEYKAIRIGLEQNIRFAHELTITRLLFLAWSFGLLKEDSHGAPKSGLLNAVQHISDEAVRERVSLIIMRVYVYMVAMMLAKSLVFWLLFPFVLVAFAIIRAFAKIFTMCKRRVRRVVGIVGDVIQIEAEYA